MAQLICRDVVLGYEGKAVVQHLNFEVNQGDYLCIVGENGSGKSTLIKTLLGLRTPMSGMIRMGDGLEADSIGYLPQQTVVQRDFPASVQEIVLSGCLGRFGWRPFYSPIRFSSTPMRSSRWEPPMISPIPGTRQSAAATVLPSSLSRI